MKFKKERIKDDDFIKASFSAKGFLSHLLEMDQYEDFEAYYKAQGSALNWRWDDENTILHQAVRQKKIKFVKCILEEEKKDEKRLLSFLTAECEISGSFYPIKENPLRIAVSTGNIPLVKLLIQYGANIPEICLAREGAVSVVDSILNSNGTERCSYGKKEHPIVRAIANNDLDMLTYFLKLPAFYIFTLSNNEATQCTNPLERAFFLTFLLIEAIHHGRPELCDFLIKEGAALPTSFMRKIEIKQCTFLSMKFTPPTVLSLFLTGSSLPDRMKEYEQQRLIEIFEELSPPDIQLSVDVIKMTFLAHQKRPYILFYAIDKFLSSISEGTRRGYYLKTFIYWTVKNFFDPDILKFLKAKSPWSLFVRTDFSLTTLLKNYVKDYDGFNDTTKRHVKQMLTYFVEWATDVSNNIKKSSLSNHYSNEVKVIKEAAQATFVAYGELERELAEKDRKETDIKIEEISFSC